MDVLNSPDVSVVEYQPVPTRISVVLVEEAKSGGVHRMECSRVDQDLRLLAGMAKPASVFVRTVIYRQVPGRCCLLQTLPRSYFRLYLPEYRSQRVRLAPLARVG